MERKKTKKALEGYKRMMAGFAVLIAANDPKKDPWNIGSIKK